MKYNATSASTSIAATARRRDDERVAGHHGDLRQRPEAFHSPVRALHPILARRTALAAHQAEGPVAPAVAQNGGRHGLQEANPAQASIAAAPASGASGPRTNDVGLETHGESKLQDLRVGQARIGHVDLDHAGARKFGTRA